MSNPQTAVARRDLKELLDTKYRAPLERIMRERAPQFAAALVQIVNRSYQLQQCDPGTIVGAAITASALDLSVDPALGEAWLVPYKTQCAFQMGYRGWIQLAMRTGQYRRLGAVIVYQGELQHYDELTGELKIDKKKRTSDEVIGYAAWFQLVNLFERGEFWTKDEVTKHAARYSQAYKAGKKDSPWFTHFDEMALKSVITSLLKQWGPKSVQMRQALFEDNSVRPSPDAPAAFIDTDEPPPAPDAPPAIDLPAEPEPPKEAKKGPPVLSPQQHLESLVTGFGHTFETFRKYCGESGNIEDADSLASFSDVPVAVAERMIKAKLGLKTHLDHTVNPV